MASYLNSAGYVKTLKTYLRMRPVLTSTSRHNVADHIMKSSNLTWPIITKAEESYSIPCECAGAICGTNDFERSLMDLHDGSLMILGPTMDPRQASLGCPCFATSPNMA